MSFILTSAPAQANQHEWADFDRGDKRQQKIEQRLERRIERQLEKSPSFSTPIVTNPIVNPVLSPIFQNRNAANLRPGNLQQPRIARAELATSKKEARQSLKDARQLSASQQLSAKTVQALDSGKIRNVNARLDLDLTSAKDSIVLGQNLFEDSASVTVTVGGVEKTFTAGSKVTASEYASILQAMNGGQTLVLDDKGRASGGDLNFETLTASGDNLKLSSLVIPEQVAAIGNFSKHSDVKLKGDVTNYGSIYAIANRDGATKANIVTNNLTNAEGGLISSVANSSLGSDLASNVDLRLRADDTLSNQGTIESSGDLELSAGNQLINGDAKGRASSASVIAQNNLILDAPSISNSGSMTASNGNVNVVSPSLDGTTSGSITFNNENGTVSALNGKINFRDPAASGKPATTITGGDWLSREFNINGAEGNTDVNVNNLTGLVNLHAGEAHVAAKSSSLRLGEIVTTGDPSITNLFDIEVTSNITTINGGPLALIAGGNILIDPGVLISTANAAGAGGSLLMVAGADFEDDTDPTHLGQDWILGGDADGGGIYMTGVGGATISSNGTTNAGIIQMISFSDTTTGDFGDVFLGTSTVTAQGSSTGLGGNNGNITVIARAIDIAGAINARGTNSTVGTGNISLNSFTPVITGGSEVRIDHATGAILSGGFGVGAAPIDPGAITIGNVTAGGTTTLNSSLFINTSALNSTGSVTINSLTATDTTSITSGGAVSITAGASAVTNAIAATGSVTITTGQNVSTDAINSGGNVLVNAGTNISGTGAQLGTITATGTATVNAAGQVDLLGVTASSMSVTSLDDVSLSGSLVGPGGITIVSGLSIFSLATIPLISTASASSSAGDIVMIAGAAFSQNAATITITGASATGGAIDFDFAPVTSLTSRSTAVNGAGGDITLVAFFGSANSGFVSTDVTTAVTTGGSGTGANGDFTAIAGRTSGFGMGIFGSVNTTGGTGANGNVVLATATPNTSANEVITRANATYTNSFVGGTLQDADMETGAITSRNNITIQAGNFLTLGGTLTSTQGAINVSSGDFLFANTVNAGTGSISLVTNDSMSLNGSLTGRAGILLVSGADIFTNVAGLSISSSGSGSSGDVSIVTGAAFTPDATTVTVTGASTTGGGIFFNNSNLTTINTSSTSGVASGGDVNLIAFTGSSDFGIVDLDATTTILTGGNAGGANGDVTVVAGHATASVGINIGSINTTGGALNTGNIVISNSTPDAAPAVQFSKTTAQQTGSFLGGAPLTANVTIAGNLTVNNGADISIFGGPITTNNLSGGANSVLTMTSSAGNDININTITLGTATINSGGALTISSINQGAAGTVTLTAANQATLGTITSGVINVSAGNIDLLGAITGTSLSAVSNLDINLNDNITTPGGILLVASRNIRAAVDGVIDLSTFSNTTDAGDISIIAGAAFSQNAGTVTITGASTTGGFVDFDFNAINNINARSTAANGSGGNITMIAFNGTDGTGFVFTDPDNTLIRTGGNGTGANGNFTAIAAAAGGDGIGIRGGLITTGGDITTGDVHVATATPVTTTNVVLQKSNPSITAGDFRGGAVTASNLFIDDVTVASGADITLRSGGDVIAESLTGGINSVLTITSVGDTTFTSTNAGTVLVTAGNNVFAGNILQGVNATSTLTINAGGLVQVAQITSGRIFLAAGTDLFLGGPIQSNTSFSGVAGGFIDLDNVITAPGGILLVAGRDITPNSTGVDLRTSSNIANAGDITIIAGAAFTQNATTVTVTGGSTLGGNIDFDFVALNTIDARSTLSNGVGGDITMIAFDGVGLANTGIIFTDPVTSQILTGGSGNGANGNFTAIAGANSGAGIGIRGTVNTTGGLAGTGDVFAATATPNTVGTVVIQKNDASVGSSAFKNGATTAADLFIDNVTVNNGADITLNGGLAVQAGALTAGALSVLTINSGTFTLLGATNAGTVDITAGTDVIGSTFLQGANGILNITGGGTINVNQIISGNVRLAAGVDVALTNSVLASGSVVATALSDIIISNDITAPGGILLVAGRNVFANAIGVELTTESTTTNAGDLSIITGAAFTQNGTSVTVTGASATGGQIDFDATDVVTINTRSTAANGSGGDLNLIAFLGSDLTGQVFTDGTTAITTGGTGAGVNGNVTIVAGNAADNALNVASINTAGGSGGGGNVFIAASTPDTTPSVVLSKTNAAITAGDFTTTGTNTGGNIFTGNITTGTGGSINISTNGFAELGSLTGTNSSVRVSTGLAIGVGAITANNTALTAGGFIRLDGSVVAPGGILMVSGIDIFGSTPGLTISSNSNTGDAGNIGIFAGATFTQNATSVTITGASATGGRIDFDSTSLAALTANSTFAGGDAGNITLFSQFGSDGTGEVFTNVTTDINASGSGAGSNGNITIVGAKNNGFAGIAINGDINISGGAAGTGSISLNTSAFNGNVTLAKATAAITAGTVTGGALRNSDIFANDLTVRGGNITARSGANVQLEDLNVSGNVLGAGGTINISTASAETLVLGSVLDLNQVASLNAAGGSTSGNGGAILATNSGTGGIDIASSLNVNATEGNGGTISVLASNGDLTLSGTSTLNANGGTTSATARSGGAIILQGNNITGTGNISLLANGVSGGNGGNVIVTSGVGDILIGTAAGQFQAQAAGPNGTISFTSTNGGDVTVTNTGSLSSSLVSLSSTGGAIAINGAVTGTTGVNLSVTGANTITGTSTVSGGTLAIAAGTGAVTLNTNVNQLSVATSGIVTITETDDVTVLGTAGTFNLNATGDDITVTGSLTANGGITLTTSGTGTVSGGTLVSAGQLAITTGTGAVNVTTDVNSFTANTTGSIVINEANNIILNNIVATSLNVTAGNGIAHGTGFIDADTINFAALGGDIGASSDFIQINNGASPVSLTATATGDIYINIQGTGLLNWGVTTGDDITLTSNGPITTTGDITAAGDLDITTNVLTNANDLTAGDTLSIQSQAGSGLTINGGAGGTMTGDEIEITASFGDLTFTGATNFFGPATLTAIAAPGASVIIAAGANVVGADSVTIVSNSLNQQGTITGNPLTFNNDFFTIANSQGDVNLTGSMVFNGQDLAILASGSINITGGATSIDLSDAGDAGTLTLVAGYDFTPSTGGQITTGAQFVFVPNNQSASGGSINLGNTDIILSSSGGDGGNLLAVATAGTTIGSGAITLNDIITTGDTAGNVTIIAEGNLNTGIIDTTGSVTDGNVHLAVAVPNITGGNMNVSNGTASGGTFTSTTLASGSLIFQNIVSANNVTLRGGLGASDNILHSIGNGVNANTLTVEVGQGGAFLDTTVNVLNASGDGVIDISDGGNLQLGTLSSPNNTLTLNVVASGVITTPLGGITDVANLSLTGSAGVGGTAIVLNGPITTYSSLSLTANGGADIVINNLTLTSPVVTLTSTLGDVILANTSTINATTSVEIDAGDTFVIAGNINTQSLTLTSADDITNSDLTGTISAPLGLSLTSTAGSIGTDENNRFVTNSSELVFSASGGGVYVQSTATGGVNVLDVSAATEVDLIAVGPVTVNDVTTGGGDISIVQTGIGTFTVAAGASLTTTEGDIILQNLDIGKKTGKIVIDDGANIKASGTTAGVGEVFIAIGALPVPPYPEKNKKAPKNVTVNETGGGRVVLGKKGIDTKKETNITLNALGRDLVFSLADKLKKKSIHVGSNVTITADPPWDKVPTRAVTGSESRIGSTINAMSLSTGLAASPANSSSSLAMTSVGADILSSSFGQGATVSELTTTLSNLAPVETSSTALLESRAGLSGTAADALASIYGDDSGNEFALALDATLVSDHLPNAVKPAGNTVASTHTMSSGSAVFAPTRNLTVSTPHTNIAIAADSVVLVVAGPHGTSVYDLHDAKKQAISLSFHGQTLALSPGRHAMVCANEKQSYADANLAELILHRGLNTAKTARGGSVFTSEFSMNSAIDCVPVLRNLMASKEPTAAKIAAKMTKTQAVILYLSQSKEEFQQHVRSQITAMR